MTRSSAIQSNGNIKNKQLPLHLALKRGAIALHLQLSETGKGVREPPFKTKTGISYGITAKGGREKRIFIYVTYAKTREDQNTVEKEVTSAIKSKIPLHIGRIKGAFWMIISLTKRKYRKITGKWTEMLKSSLKWLVYLFLLLYSVLHPELKDIITKIMETPLFPSY